MVTLDGAGLTPTALFASAVSGLCSRHQDARRHSDYLIDRAMQLFPSRTAEGKSKALNYLLPHIRRMPNASCATNSPPTPRRSWRIDSALVREELRQAVRKRRDEVHAVRQDALNEAERVLLRAAATLRNPRFSPAYPEALRDQPQSFEGLSVTPTLAALRDRGAIEPLAAVSDPRQRAVLAQALLRESGELELRERRSRARVAEIPPPRSPTAPGASGLLPADIRNASSPENATTARKSSVPASGTCPGVHVRPPSTVRRYVPRVPLAHATCLDTALTPRKFSVVCENCTRGPV